MRHLLNITAALAVGVLVTAVLIGRQSQRDEVDATEHTVQSLTRLYERTSYHAAIDHAQLDTPTLWPVAVLPDWFGGALPTNRCLSDDPASADRPWLDIAPPGDKRAHPPDPVAVRRDQAQFWYNPHVGVFRARVPADLPADEALALYNHLNGVTLAALMLDADPRRAPLAYAPGRPPVSTASAAPHPAQETPALAETAATPVASDPVAEAPPAGRRTRLRELQR